MLRKRQSLRATIPATLDMMVLHTGAVARAVQQTFLVSDLPFLSYRKSLRDSMQAVEALMRAGAQAVKLEGVHGNSDLIQHIVASGVPVMGHIGLTPQSVHALGGFRVQGRQAEQANDLVQQAKALEAAGCFLIVLECMPADLARRITDALHIPTIGIGAGPHTSGQILVWQDLLGMQVALKAKFIKRYFNGAQEIKQALNRYHEEVVQAIYPDVNEHSYE